MTTDPGAVPKDAIPLDDDMQENDLEANANKKENPYVKYCKRCHAFKPIRAHHCSICGRCIVKMVSSERPCVGAIRDLFFFVNIDDCDIMFAISVVKASVS
jgi:hypothetical protein